MGEHTCTTVKSEACAAHHVAVLYDYMMLTTLYFVHNVIRHIQLLHVSVSNYD